MGVIVRVAPSVRSNLQMPPPAAATITVRATLALLDGPKREIAEGVANDEYVFWLGSGISRERLPDLRDVAKRVLVTLQARIDQSRSEEHTSELQSLMRISYAVFCLKKKK